MSALCFALLGYLLGGILFAYYLPLWCKGIDVTQGAPDQNPGVFNCMKRAGKPLGILALVCDLAKGAIPVFWAARVLDPAQWPFALVMAAPVLGHAFPVLRGFKGGKAITVTFGVMLGLCPLWQPLGLLVGSYLFFSLVVQVRPNRTRSIVTFLCFALGAAVWLRGGPVALGCALASAVVILRHETCREVQGERASVRFVLSRRDR